MDYSNKSSHGTIEKVNNHAILLQTSNKRLFSEKNSPFSRKKSPKLGNTLLGKKHSDIKEETMVENRWLCLTC